MIEISKYIHIWMEDCDSDDNHFAAQLERTLRQAQSDKAGVEDGNCCHHKTTLRKKTASEDGLCIT